VLHSSLKTRASEPPHSISRRTNTMPDAQIDEELAAQQLLARFGNHAARRGSPMWFEVRTNTEGEPTTAEVPYPDGLLGYVVREDWPAAAVVATGRFRRLDAAAELPAALVRGLGGGLQIACVVSRRDAVGWHLRLPDGSTFDEVPQEGFMLDVLRRSLGLPTSPPPPTTATFHLSAWLCGIASAGTSIEPHTRTRLGWDDAVALHPLFDGPGAESGDAEDFIDAVQSSGNWESLRKQVTSAPEGNEDYCLPPPHLADWMDEGMFARWVLGKMPTPESLLGAVRPVLQSAAYRRLAHLVRAVERVERAA
jgi:hypothetical protein